MIAPPNLSTLINTAATQGNPIEALRIFLDSEERLELRSRSIKCGSLATFSTLVMKLQRSLQAIPIFDPISFHNKQRTPRPNGKLFRQSPLKPRRDTGSFTCPSCLRWNRGRYPAGKNSGLHAHDDFISSFRHSCSSEKI